MRSTWFRATGLLILILPISACNQGASTSELTGKVTYKGTPLTMGEVFVKSDSGVEASGQISPDGTYTIKNAPRGNLKVRVHCVDEAAANAYYKAMAGRSDTPGDPIGPDGKPAPKGKHKPFEMADFGKIPKKYFDYETSGLTVEVKDAKAQKEFPLD